MKIFLALMACLVAISVAELYVDDFHVSHVLTGRYESDPILEYRLKPNHFEGGLQNTNSLGFRSREDTQLSKQPGRIRLLAIGDSFTYGATEVEDTYPAQLQRILRLRGKPVEVVNGGVPGYGTDQEYHVLRTAGLQLQPDIVILGFFVGNDVHDVLVTNENAVLGGELVSRAVYEQSKESIWKNLALRTKLVKERMQLFQLFQGYEWRVRWKWYRGRDQHSPTWAEDWYLNVQSFRVANLSVQWNESQRGRSAWARALHYVSQIHQLCADQNIPFVVLIIPDEMQVVPAIRNKVVQLSGVSPQDLVIDLPQRRLIDFLNQQNIVYVDLLPVFQFENQQHSLYIEYDTHLNASGNKRAATLLAKLLISRNIVH